MCLMKDCCVLGENIFFFFVVVCLMMDVCCVCVGVGLCCDCECCCEVEDLILNCYMLFVCVLM